MFSSFQEFDEEAHDNWRNDKDPLARLHEKIDNLERQLEMQELKRRISRLENQLNAQTLRRQGSREEWRDCTTTRLASSSSFGPNFGSYWTQCGPQWGPRLRTQLRTRASMDHEHHHVEASNSLKHQANAIDNIIKAACGEEWGPRPGTQLKSWAAVDKVQSARDGVRFEMDTDMEEYNSGLSNNSCFSLFVKSPMSQPDPRFTFFAETYGSHSPLQMPSEELMWEEFMINQRKKNEELLGRLNSLQSKFDNSASKLEKLLENKIAQETCSPCSPLEGKNDELLLQSDRELESFSCHETHSDESTQIESNEKQEKVEKPNVVASQSYVPPILFPLRLTYIDKSNELEISHSPIDCAIDEADKKEDDGTSLQVEASDITNDGFTKIDLRPQLEECLKSQDVTRRSEQQMKNQVHFKHTLSVLLNQFWVNYDALHGRKVKIR